MPEGPGNRLVALDSATFRLVREEQEVSEGVVYTLQAGHDALPSRRVVRPAMKGEQDFCNSSLTANGLRAGALLRRRRSVAAVFLG